MDTEEALRAALADAARLRAHVEHAENERLYMSVGKQAAEATLALATERARAAEERHDRLTEALAAETEAAAEARALNTRLLSVVADALAEAVHAKYQCASTEILGTAPGGWATGWPKRWCASATPKVGPCWHQRARHLLAASDNTANRQPTPASDPLRGAAE